MYIEKQKAKVVDAGWGTEFIQFLAALAVLHWADFEKYDEFILFFKSSWCNSSFTSNPPSGQQLRVLPQGIEYILSPKQQRRPLAFLLSLSFFYRNTDAP